MKRINIRTVLFSAFVFGLIVLLNNSAAASINNLDNPTTGWLVYHPTAQDTIIPRYDNFSGNYQGNPFDLNDPSIITKEVEYDPESGLYYIMEKMGDEYYRTPTSMTFEEYMNWRASSEQQQYFSDLSNDGQKDRSISGIVDPIAKFDLKNNLIDRLFGGTKVDIRPQGNIDLTFGWNYSRSQNPGITVRQQTTGGFNFDMNINMSVQGSIGEKLKLNFDYNSKPSFDFDNQMKLHYDPTQFSEDDIIQNIEAGNVSLPLNGTLITGAQSLFGIRLDTKWGPLRLSTIVSQQKSQQKDIEVQGGAQFQEFEVFADEYDENRHFFLTHYNRSAFEESLKNLPQIKSVFSLEHVEVYITNDQNSLPEDRREIVAFTDLGEPDNLTSPDLINVQNPVRDRLGRGLPDNDANDLMDRIQDDALLRNLDQAINRLQSPAFGLQQGKDFEKVNARMLVEGSDYFVNKELGYISLNVNVQPDQVVGVAFQYSYNGEVFQVGEFRTQVPTNFQERNTNNPTEPVDSTNKQKVLFVKMLKSATQRVDLPSWDLMMKNVYNIGAYNVNQADFKFDIYYDEPGNGEKRFMPQGSGIGDIPLLRVFNLDTLNTQGDPFPDGVFDFVQDLTIYPRNGRIMFPVLEPFDDALKRKIPNSQIASRYTYPELYDSTITRAREFLHKNRFVMRGEYKSTVSSEIRLNAFNIPRRSDGTSSVTVSAGGKRLDEGRDYEIDYSLGIVRILNDAYLTSGVPIKVSFEDNSLFNFQQKNLIGIRADYDVNKNLIVGGTYLHLFERPYTNKVNFGDDPINNRIYGLDFTYGQEAPWLTKAVDAIPFIDTKEKSKVNITMEAAALQPGHSKAINDGTDNDKGGVVYIDDFEGSVSTYSLHTAPTRWSLASVPQNDAENNNPDFPEAKLEGINSGINRALLNWYTVDGTVSSIDGALEPYSSVVQNQEIFPNAQRQSFENILRPLNLTIYPDERGPYNFDPPSGVPGFSAGIESNDGTLLEPETRWAGIMNELPNNNFEQANIEFIEFWMLSPFLDEANAEQESPDALLQQGELFINLGNISEDILKDSRQAYENGMPGPEGSISENRNVDETSWGRVPQTPPLVNAFDNTQGSRETQDLGLDCLDDAGEQEHFEDYLDQVRNSSLIQREKDKIIEDPSTDNFEHFVNVEVPDGESSIYRYKKFNNPQNNSPENQSFNQVQSAKLTPDTEDLNGDNTLNESEAYYQYKIPIEYGGNREVKRNKFITDRVEAENGRIWYRYKIPLDQHDARVGGIQDFRSIRFVRIYMKGFKAKTTLRLVDFGLGRNQWRRYLADIKDNGPGFPDLNYPETIFDVNDVNVEENSDRTPFPYILPEGIKRETNVGGFQNVLQNEQSLTMTVDNLQDGYSKAIYKLIKYDLRVFEKIKMFIHAEHLSSDPFVEDGEVSVFMRIGQDFETNYYEFEVPLVFSKDSTLTDELEISREVWKRANNMDISLKQFKDLKLERNEKGIPGNVLYEKEIKYGYFPPGESEVDSVLRKVKILGNPDLGTVKGAMIGVRNARNDGLPHSAEVWVNELRLNGLDESGGVAAIGRADFQLADFGQVTTSGRYSSIGFGSLDEKLAERNQDELVQYDISGSFELGKFFNNDLGIKVPFLAQYSNEMSIPRFDPILRDIELKESLNRSGANKDSIRNVAISRTEIKSLNFTNVHKERGSGSAAKPMPWDIENWNATYSYTETDIRTPLIESDNKQSHLGALDYQYNTKGYSIQPFQKLIKKDKYLKLLSNFNFNPVPNSFTFGTSLDRQRQKTKYRPEFSSPNDRYNTFFNKRFGWDRDYNLNWELTKALKLNFNATNTSVIDELQEYDPETGVQNTAQQKKDFILENMKELGRTKGYDHSLSLSYTLPFKLIPLMEFINVRTQYNSTYSWTAASLNTTELGNIISNSQKREINGDMSFDKLYKKSKYLKAIMKPTKSKKKSRKNNKEEGEKSSKEKSSKKETPEAAKKKKKSAGPSAVEKALVRPLLMVRKARFKYNETFRTVVPGFMPQAKLFGLENGFGSPGWDFVAGLQPDDAWFDKAADKANNFANPWISTDFFLNQKVLQEYSQTYDGKLSLEPYPDFKIDIEANRKYSENHSEIFKDNVDDNINNLVRLLPQDVGSLSVSYFSANTLFGNDDFGVDLFRNFESNREVISSRLGVEGSSHATDAGYTQGYGKKQQEVLIPAFVSAYTDQDPGQISLDIFNTLPRPNWTINYNGLSKLSMLKDIFQTISIKHGYRSTLTVSSYNTNLNYEASNPVSRENLNEETNSYYSQLEIPNVVIQEAFSPLIGIDIKTKTKMNIKLEYKKSRNLGMNFTSFQLAETKSTEYVVGYGYRLENIDIPFLRGGKKKKGKGKEEDNKTKKKSKIPSSFRGGGGGSSQPQDMNINFDFSWRDDITINHLLDQEVLEPTRGQLTLRISPSVDYQLNKSLNLRLFVDYSLNQPKTSQQPPRTDIQGGLMVRFTLN